MNKIFSVEANLKDATTATEDGKVVIEGWANLAFAPDGSALPDSDDEVILPSGIDLKRFKRNPVMLFSHNGRQVPIGKFTEVETKPEGLWVKGEVYSVLNTEVYEAVRLGVLTSFSIGFRGKSGKYLPDSDTFIFTEIELHEISIVTVPAAEQSQFGIVKSMDGYCLGGVCKNKSMDRSEYMEEKETTAIVEKQTEATLSDVVKALSDIKSLLTPVITEEKAVEKEEVTEDVEAPVEIEEKAVEKVDVIKELEALEVTADNFEAVLGAIDSLKSKCNTLLKQELGE